jgi:hypothetical protein
MKVCTKCGTQNNDVARFCAKCGNALAAADNNANPVNPNPAVAPNVNVSYVNPNPVVAPNVNAPYVNPNVNPNATPAKSNEKKGALVAFFYNLVSLFYAAFAYLAVVFAYVGEGGYYYTRHFFWFEGGFVIAATVSAALLLVLGIINLVLGFAKKGDLKATLSGVFRLIAAIVALAVAGLTVMEHA